MASKLALEKRLASLRMRAADSARKTGHVSAALGGASVAGYVRGRFPKLREFGGTDSDLIVGGAATVLGLAGAAGSYSDIVMFGGLGMVTPALSRKLFELGDKHGKE